jgi:hypothetical protein
MFLTVLAYVLALPIIVLFDSLALILITFALMPLTRASRGKNSLAMVSSFLHHCLSAAAAACGFILIVKACRVEPVFLMFLLPCFGYLFNDLSRIRDAEAGRSAVARMLIAAGQNYDPALNVRLETASMFGSLSALFLIPLLFGLSFY